MPPHFIARQLSRPTGLLGKLVVAVMNRYNAKVNAYALEMLHLTSSDRVLEIGFGGGLNIPYLLDHAGFVMGVDRSPDVVRNAKTKFAAAAESGKASFREASIEALPFESETFDKICTVNTIYFWNSLDHGFEEIFRVLSPGGTVAVGFLPKHWMDKGDFPSDIFSPRTPEEVIVALERAGFTQVHITRPHETTRWNVVLASR